MDKDTINAVFILTTTISGILLIIVNALFHHDWFYYSGLTLATIGMSCACFEILLNRK